MFADGVLREGIERNDLPALTSNQDRRFPLDITTGLPDLVVALLAAPYRQARRSNTKNLAPLFRTNINDFKKDFKDLKDLCPTLHLAREGDQRSSLPRPFTGPGCDNPPTKPSPPSPLAGRLAGGKACGDMP